MLGIDRQLYLVWLVSRYQLKIVLVDLLENYFQRPALIRLGDEPLGRRRPAMLQSTVFKEPASQIHETLLYLLPRHIVLFL